MHYFLSCLQLVSVLSEFRTEMFNDHNVDNVISQSVCTRPVLSREETVGPESLLVVHYEFVNNLTERFYY